MFSIIGLLFSGVFFLIGLVACIFWIWMLVSAVQNNGLSTGEKVGWVLVILFLHFLGGLLYFLIGHPKRFNVRY